MSAARNSRASTTIIEANQASNAIAAWVPAGWRLRRSLKPLVHTALRLRRTQINIGWSFDRMPNGRGKARSQGKPKRASREQVALCNEASALVGIRLVGIMTLINCSQLWIRQRLIGESSIRACAVPSGMWLELRGAISSDMRLSDYRSA